MTRVADNVTRVAESNVHFIKKMLLNPQFGGVPQDAHSPEERLKSQLEYLSTFHWMTSLQIDDIVANSRSDLLFLELLFVHVLLLLFRFEFVLTFAKTENAVQLIHLVTGTKETLYKGRREMESHIK